MGLKAGPKRPHAQTQNCAVHTVHAVLQGCEECRAIAAAGDATGQAGLLQAQVTALSALAGLVPNSPQ